MRGIWDVIYREPQRCLRGTPLHKTSFFPPPFLLLSHILILPWYFLGITCQVNYLNSHLVSRSASGTRLKTKTQLTHGFWISSDRNTNHTVITTTETNAHSWKVQVESLLLIQSAAHMQRMLPFLWFSFWLFTFSLPSLLCFVFLHMVLFSQSNAVLNQARTWGKRKSVSPTHLSIFLFFLMSKIFFEN